MFFKAYSFGSQCSKYGLKVQLIMFQYSKYEMSYRLSLYHPFYVN